MEYPDFDFPKEDLDSELVECLVREELGEGIFHPLIISYPHNPKLNHQTNKDLHYKKKRVS